MTEKNTGETTQGVSRPKWHWRRYGATRRLIEIAQQYEVHPNQVTEWKRQLLERAAEVFEGVRGRQERERAGPEGAAREDRAAGAGNRFFKRRAHQSGIAERKRDDRPYP